MLTTENQEMTKEQLIESFAGRSRKERKCLEDALAYGPLDVRHLAEMIEELDLFGTFKINAWVTRSGRVWTTQYEGHDRCLKALGLRRADVERAGWMHLSGINRPHINSYSELSRQQAHFLRKRGLEYDKPSWRDITDFEGEAPYPQFD